MATNPVDSMPEADTVRAVLAACPFVVVSDVARHTDTTALAHVLLPAAAWGEKDGTVTNSERRISRQRRFLGWPGETRPDWWQLREVAKRMGFGGAFTYSNPAEIFAEYACLTASENDGKRDLDIGVHGAISSRDYDQLEPFQWPRAAGSPKSESRFFASGRFYTPDGKARFVSTPFRPPASETSTELPLSLNTGRIRDQWHTMTRTAKAPRLVSHVPEPFLDVHPEDAKRCGLEHGHLAVVRSRHGDAILRIAVTDRQRKGSVFAPMHWTDQLASKARVDALMAGDTDPHSGQPELKHTPVSVTTFAAGWHGLAVTRCKPARITADYWALAPCKGGWRLELAGTHASADWSAFAAGLLCPRPSDPGDLLAYHDRAMGQHRFALFEDATLAGVLFAGREPVTVPRAWAAERLAAGPLEAGERFRLLAGRPGHGTRDRGALVCACFEVGLNQIVDAITAGACMTVDQVGAALRAGTNCGSCRSDIRRIIDESRLAKAG